MAALFSLLVLLPALAADLPPATLYHVGNKETLLEDANAGTIPQDAWDKFVMGEGTRYGLVPFRRGLYGGEELASLELYGNDFVGTPKDPWVMAIQVKDSCRTPETVNGLFTDERFQNYVIAHLNEFLTASTECLNYDPEDCNDLINFEEVKSVAKGRAENTCEALLQKYVQGSGAKIVADHEWKNSWYLRDRDCIAGIKAAPAEVLEMMAGSDWSLKIRSQYSSPAPVFGLASLLITTQALSETKDPPAAVLTKLKEKMAASDITFGYTNYYKPAHLEELWIKQIGPEVMNAYERCQKSGARKDFKNFAQKIRAHFHEPDSGKPEKITAYFDALPATLASLCQ